MLKTSPESNTIVCKQLQPSSHPPSSPPDLIVLAEAAKFVGAVFKFGETDDELLLLLLQTLTTLQTSCWLQTTPVVVESEVVVVGFVVVVPGAAVVVAGIVVVFQPFVVVS